MGDDATQPPDAAAAPRRGLARRLFGIDLRSLAAFRIALGGLLLFDLLARTRHIGALYTDDGVLPLETWRKLGYGFSLHALGGGYTYELFLFALAIALAALLLVGLHTRLATIGSWVLLTSLHHRSIMLLDGGDHLMRMMLLWGSFLPLEAHWSLDARRKRVLSTSDGLLVSPAGFGLLLQFVFFFGIAGLAKTGPEWTTDHTAMEIALRRGYWSRPLGDWMAQYPDVLKIATPVVRWFEILVPALLFVPFRNAAVRVLTLLVYWGFLVGLSVSIQLNLFPFISCAAALPFVPSAVWDRLLGAPRSLERFVPGPLALRAARDAVATLLVVYATVLNLQSFGKVRVPDALLAVSNPAGIFQNWFMYAPSPPNADFSFEYAGQTASGERVDLLATDGPAGWSDVQDLHRSYRFKYYFQRLAGLGPEHPLQADYLRWMCRSWNEGGSSPWTSARRVLDDDERLEALAVISEGCLIVPGEESEKQRFVLMQHVCPGGS